MTRVDSVFESRLNSLKTSRWQHNFVVYKPGFTLESLFDNLDRAAGKDEKVKLKQVLYGFGGDRKMHDQSQSTLGTQILDLFYRLALAENFNEIASKNHMISFLWYVKSYQEFQVALFQWGLQTLDVENLMIDQISHIVVPDINSLGLYKNKDGKYDIITLSHDCLYNAITLAVCARKTQLLSGLYTPSWTDSQDEKEGLTVKDERRVFFEQQTIVALGKAEALYGMYMGLRISVLPALLSVGVKPGTDKSNELKKHFKEMFLNYIVNDAPTDGWRSVDMMMNAVAPKMLLVNQRIYKKSSILSVESMKLDLYKHLHSQKVKDYRHEYYVNASYQGREEFKGFAKVEKVKKRADELDKKRSEMRKSQGLD